MLSSFFGKPGTVLNVSFTAASAQSSAVSDSIRELRLVATQNCYYKVGANPTATTSDTYLPSGTVEYIAIAPGEKVAAIRSSADGTLNITEMTK
jgi:hypothetical protein